MGGKLKDLIKSEQHGADGSRVLIDRRSPLDAINTNIHQRVRLFVLKMIILM